MEISVEFASVLAQIMPTFLLVALFERFVSTRRAPRPSRGWRLAGVLARYVIVILCMLVFAISLAVVFAGEPLRGAIALTVIVPCVLLLLALFITIETWYAGIAEAANDDDDAAEAHAQPER